VIKRAPLHSQRAIDQLQKDLAASRASETRLQHDVQQVSNLQHRSFCRCWIIRVTCVCIASSTLLLPRSDLLSLQHSLTRHLASAHAIKDLFAAAQVAQQHGAALQDLRTQLSASRAEASACASALAAATADRGAAVVRRMFLDIWPHEPTSRIYYLCIAICARRDGNVLQLQARAAELAALAETQAAVAGVDAASLRAALAAAEARAAAAAKALETSQVSPKFCKMYWEHLTVDTLSFCSGSTLMYSQWVDSRYAGGDSSGKQSARHLPGRAGRMPRRHRVDGVCRCGSAAYC